MGSIAPKTILSESISLYYPYGSLSIESEATACRIRLISCHALVQQQTLVIDEFEELPPGLPRYAAISYVWKGNPPSNSHPVTGAQGYITVAGAEPGDPISLSVLHCACASVMAYSYPEIGYIWLDRLCIIQSNPEDKSWQIKQMFDVYKNAEFAIVLPGGIYRLVGLNEETAWAHRAWTLQEVLAPPPYTALVLHLWNEGNGSMGSWENKTVGAIWQVQTPDIYGRCALTNLDNLVEACMEGKLKWTPGVPTEVTSQTVWEAREWRIVENVKIIGRPKNPSLHALLDALRSRNSELSGFNQYAIWKSALTRTSSRPVDMVFSIMGFFGITLDPKDYRSDDRMGATFALAKEILNKGGSASWLGVSTRVSPSRSLSTFPQFPETSVEGNAFIRTQEGQLIDATTIVDEDTYIGAATGENMISGEIDDFGHLKFWREACALTPNGTQAVLEPSYTVQSVDGRVWNFYSGANFNECPFPRFAAVVLGHFMTRDSSSEGHDEIVKLMLLAEHAKGMFHIEGFFRIHDTTRGNSLQSRPYSYLPWRSGEANWKKYFFNIGGIDLRYFRRLRESPFETRGIPFPTYWDREEDESDEEYPEELALTDEEEECSERDDVK